jgi:hypothetical protein
MEWETFSEADCGNCLNGENGLQRLKIRGLPQVFIERFAGFLSVSLLISLTVSPECAARVCFYSIGRHPFGYGG